MSNVPPSGQPDPSRALDGGPRVPEMDPHLLAALALRDAGKIGSMQIGSAEKARRALDVRIDIVKDPSAAPRLNQRHNIHLVTETFARFMYKFLRDRDSVSEQELLRLYDNAKKRGMFVLPSTDELMARRIAANDPTSDENMYIIAEASGRYPDAHGIHSRSRQSTPAADCQIHVPGRGSKARPTIQFPQAGDEIINPEFVAELEGRESAIACIEDAACDPDMMNLALASGALDRAVRELVNNVNDARNGEYIQYLAAEFVSLQGIRMKDGTVATLWNDLRLNPIFNHHGSERLMQFQTKDCDNFATMFILRNRELPVYEVPEVQSIILDWHTKVATVRLPHGLVSSSSRSKTK